MIGDHKESFTDAQRFCIYEQMCAAQVFIIIIILQMFNTVSSLYRGTYFRKGCSRILCLLCSQPKAESVCSLAAFYSIVGGYRHSVASARFQLSRRRMELLWLRQREHRPTQSAPVCRFRPNPVRIQLCWRRRRCCSVVGSVAMRINVVCVMFLCMNEHWNVSPRRCISNTTRSQRSVSAFAKYTILCALSLPRVIEWMDMGCRIVCTCVASTLKPEDWVGQNFTRKEDLRVME